MKRLATLFALPLVASLAGCPGNSGASSTPAPAGTEAGHKEGDGHDHGKTTEAGHKDGDGHDHGKTTEAGHKEGDGHDHDKKH